jgi:hypothetical protein
MSAIHSSLCNMLKSCLPCHKAVSSIFYVMACQTVMTRDRFKINKQLLAIKTRWSVPNTECVFWFSLQIVPETFLIPRKIQLDILNVHKSLHVKYLLFLPDFNETWIFLIDLQKVLKYQISWKPHPVGAKLFHADRQDEANSCVLQLCKHT